MTILDAVLIGVALAMDAFALTISNCTSYKNSITKTKALAMPITFAIFQFLMPVLGFYLGSFFSESLSSVGGFITAGIFFILFAKIVVDLIKDYRAEKIISCKECEQIESAHPLTFKIIIVQGIATSIDALLIGASQFAFNLSSPFFYALIVGIITFMIVAVALYIGKSLGCILGKYATYAGAVILFALAIKELIQALI